MLLTGQPGEPFIVDLVQGDTGEPGLPGFDGQPGRDGYPGKSVRVCVCVCVQFQDSNLMKRN